MRIMLVITGLQVGGAERLVTGLADSFVAKGHQVMLVALSGERALLPTDPRVRVEVISMSRSPLGVARCYLRFRSLAKEFRPDVVNTHLIHANVLIRLFRLFLPFPRLVSSAHNKIDGGRVRMLAYRLTDRLSDVLTNVSVEAVQAFIDKKAAKPDGITALHNGIDIDRFSFSANKRLTIRVELGIPDNCILILSVGRFVEQKDFPNLLSAFRRVLREDASARLVLAGDGPLRGEMEELAHELGLSERTIFLGIRHDIVGLMSACDIFVLSSAWEGFGLVVAEAMACQRVVVATDCGGVREVIGGCGLLVPPKNSDVLSNSILKAIALPDEEKVALGEAGRARVRDLYSLDIAAEKWLRLYQEDFQLESESAARHRNHT